MSYPVSPHTSPTTFAPLYFAQLGNVTFTPSDPPDANLPRAIIANNFFILFSYFILLFALKRTCNPTFWKENFTPVLKHGKVKKKNVKKYTSLFSHEESKLSVVVTVVRSAVALIRRKSAVGIVAQHPPRLTFLLQSLPLL